MFNFQMENHHRFVVQELLLEQNEKLEEALNSATNCSTPKQEEDSFDVERVREIPAFEGSKKNFFINKFFFKLNRTFRNELDYCHRVRGGALAGSPKRETGS